MKIHIKKGYTASKTGESKKSGRRYLISRIKGQNQDFGSRYTEQKSYSVTVFEERIKSVDFCVTASNMKLEKRFKLTGRLRLWKKEGIRLRDGMAISGKR